VLPVGSTHVVTIPEFHIENLLTLIRDMGTGKPAAAADETTNKKRP
jgi:hypothetical protein